MQLAKVNFFSFLEFKSLCQLLEIFDALNSLQGIFVPGVKFSQVKTPHSFHCAFAILFSLIVVSNEFESMLEKSFHLANIDTD